MKREKYFNLIKILNPKNLAKEIHAYGYHFSWKAHIFEMICILLGISAIGCLFQLKTLYFMIVVLAVIFVLPVFVLDMYKRMYEQKRFLDASTYAEQVLYSFQKSKKVVAALKETEEVFEDGQMKQILREAVSNMEAGYARTEKGILRETLEQIENAYPCSKIHMVHELLIGSEEYGGNTERSVLLMLDDIELWKRREYKLFADKKVSNADNIISVIVATILCAVTLYVLNGMGQMFRGAEGTSVFRIEIIQASSLFFILFMLLVLIKSEKKLTADWLLNSYVRNEKYTLSSYETVMHYDEKKEKKKNFLFALPFILAASIALLFGKIWVGVAGLLLAAFLLLQHRIGYQLAKKDVTRGLYIVLPQWMMEMALLLQNNNVQISIEKSIREAPPVLKKELELLTQRLKKAPDKLRSYTEFCNMFDVPEIQSCMKMLHAISESGTGNADIQIHNMVQRVHEMQNMADDISNEDMAFQMKMIFSYPVLAATIKLLIDLTIGMIYMIQILSSMGGV